MIHEIRTDESVQILLFVCVPLLVLLVALIALLVQRSRTTATFATFSVTVSRVGREETYVTYREQDRRTEFLAQIIRGKSFFVPQICVEIPREMSGEQTIDIVPKLGAGFRKLHYEFLIYQRRSLALREKQDQATLARKSGEIVEALASSESAILLEGVAWTP